MLELNQKNNNFKNIELIISKSKDDVFYFDLHVKNSDGDNLVCSLYKKARYAIDFIDFLRKKIIEEQ